MSTMELTAPTSPPHSGRSVAPRRRRRPTTDVRKAPLAGIDSRRRWGRRAKEIYATHLSDLGGLSNTSAAERSIIRRAAVLTTQLEQMEVQMQFQFEQGGEPNRQDLDLYSRTAGNLRRLLESIGLQRRAREVGLPDPLEFARQIDAQEGAQP
jgi:hypothetical protein